MLSTGLVCRKGTGMGPNACGTGRPVLRPPGGGSGALGVGLALVAVLYGSSAVPLGKLGIGQVKWRAWSVC